MIAGGKKGNKKGNKKEKTDKDGKKKGKKQENIEKPLHVILAREIRIRAARWQALHRMRAPNIHMVSEMVKITKRQYDLLKREEEKGFKFKETTENDLIDENNHLMISISQFFSAFESLACSGELLQEDFQRNLNEKMKAIDCLKINHTEKMKYMTSQSHHLSKLIQETKSVKRNVHNYLRQCYQINDVKYARMLTYSGNLKALAEKNLGDIRDVLGRNLRKYKMFIQQKLTQFETPRQQEILRKLSPESLQLLFDNKEYRVLLEKYTYYENQYTILNTFLKHNTQTLKAVPSLKKLTREFIVPHYTHIPTKCQPDDEVYLDIPHKIYVPF